MMIEGVVMQPDTYTVNAISASSRATEVLANERTFLAWIRTAIAIVTLGFVVAKFSLWLNQMAAQFGSDPAPSSNSPSMLIGLGMTALGALLPLLAAWRYHVVHRAIERREVHADRKLVILLALSLLLLSLAVMADLIVTGVRKMMRHGAAMTCCRVRASRVAMVLGWLFVSSTAAAVPNGATLASQGNDHGTPACAACHGAHGEGNAASGFPRLAGLNAGYLQTQLAAFASGQRTSTMMTPIARTLTQLEWQEMARYYAALPDSAGAFKSTTKRVKTASPDTDSAGAKLALHGRWSDGLPACVQCHGSQGVGVGSVFPALAGQSAVYLQNQLQAWQQGTRAAGPLGLMKVIADKLSDDDIQQVAAYFASLPVRSNPKGQP